MGTVKRLSDVVCEALQDHSEDFPLMSFDQQSKVSIQIADKILAGLNYAKEVVESEPCHADRT